MYVCLGAVAADVWQDIPLGLDPRVRDLLGTSVALNTTASVKQDEESSKSCTIPCLVFLTMLMLRFSSCSASPSSAGRSADAQLLLPVMFYQS